MAFYQPPADATQRILAGGEAAIQDLIRAEADAIVGTEVLLNAATGLHDEQATVDLVFERPVLVRIEKPEVDDLWRWNDEVFVDPVYPVTLIDPDYVAPDKIRLLYAHGRSWGLNGGTSEPDYVAEAAPDAPAPR